MRKSQSIKSKLTISYVLYIVIFVLFLSILSNIMIQRQFKEYSKQKQQRQLNELVSLIENQYSDGSWNQETIEGIGLYALNQGYIISVRNSDNSSVFDANIHYGHRCSMIIDDIKHMMRTNYPNWEGEYITKNYTLLNNKGNLEIGYLSPYFYTEADVSFLLTLNQIYIVAAILFILLALVMGHYMANRLSSPLTKIVHASNNIIKGVYTSIKEDQSNITEINQLTTSMNTLASSLEKQEVLRKQLTADVTHELRTPLTTLQTHIEAMLDGVIEPDFKNIENIHEEILRLSHMVTELEKLSKYDNFSIELNYEEVNISDIIKNTINLFTVAFEKKQVNLHSELVDIYLKIDKEKMSQVLINLLSNALKYTQEHGVVKIMVKKEHEHLKLILSDTGIGIPKEDLSYVFERFYRADKSRNRKTGGSGIGLSIVKSIVDAHKGDIQIKSTVNKGTTIYITLPIN